MEESKGKLLRNDSLISLFDGSFRFQRSPTPNWIINLVFSSLSIVAMMNQNELGEKTFSRKGVARDSKSRYIKFLSRSR